VTRLLTVATWNIFGGRTWDGTRVDLDLVLGTLRRLDADLVAVQEVDRDQDRSHRADQARQLGETLGMEWRYAPALLAADGRRLTVAGTHLSFVPGPNVGQLRALQRHLDERGGPRLLLGDLNLWWPAVRLLSLPGWRPLVHGGTFRNRPPGSSAPLVQLDHVLAAGAGHTLRARGSRIVSGPASDHRAVVVELEWG
jgi:endonuclease/exonuclease/phosphatase family metal-dependent hydrolase